MRRFYSIGTRDGDAAAAARPRPLTGQHSTPAVLGHARGSPKPIARRKMRCSASRPARSGRRRTAPTTSLRRGMQHRDAPVEPGLGALSRRPRPRARSAGALALACPCSPSPPSSRGVTNGTSAPAGGRAHGNEPAGMGPSRCGVRGAAPVRPRRTSGEAHGVGVSAFAAAREPVAARSRRAGLGARVGPLMNSWRLREVRDRDQPALARREAQREPLTRRVRANSIHAPARPSPGSAPRSPPRGRRQLAPPADTRDGAQSAKPPRGRAPPEPSCSVVS